MSKYSAVAPQEPTFIGGVVLGGSQLEQSEIPVHFNNKNRRRLFYLCLAAIAVIMILVIALLIYGFVIVR